jgi:predicted DNA-binding transcriptional regulator YafY
MNRIDRLTAILVQLQSKKIVTAQEVADHFEISLRTVYRDMRALEEAGIPLGAEAGKGYFIMEGYHLPPVMFSQEEANALVLGAKLIEGQTDSSIKKHFTEAMFKIKSVLKSAGKDELEKLESQIEVRHYAPAPSDDFPNNFLSSIQQALIDRRVLRFRYYANYTDDFTTRDVEPIGLIYYGSRWHLLAYCRLRKAPRDFRVDRIVKLESLDQHFDVDDDIQFKDFFTDLMHGTELEEVIISVDKEIARFISEQKYTQGFVSEEVKEDRVEMTFLVPGLDYFSRWLLMLGKSTTVISPKKLNSIMSDRIEELRSHYGDHSNA